MTDGSMANPNHAATFGQVTECDSEAEDTVVATGVRLLEWNSAKPERLQATANTANAMDQI